MNVKYADVFTSLHYIHRLKTTAISQSLWIRLNFNMKAKVKQIFVIFSI